MEMQQGQALSQGIAGAGQGIAQGISQAALTRFQAGQQTQQQAARAAVLQGLQNQRIQAGRYDQAVDEYIKAGGVPGQPPPGIDMGPLAPGAGPPPAGGQPGVQPTTVGSGFMGPPAPGQARTQPIELTTPQVAPQEPAGVPLPVIEPSAIGKYRKTQEKLRRYDLYKETIDTDSFMPRDEWARQTARLAQVTAPLRAFLAKHPEPKPPRTHEEIVAAGPHGGGATPIPGTYNSWISDGKGGTKVSTATHPKEDVGWMAIPDAEKRSEAKQAHLENHLQERDDIRYLWDGKQGRWEEQKEERDDFDWGDYIEKGSGKISSDTGKPLFTMDELITQASQVDSAIDQARLQQAIQEAPDAPAILNLVKSRAHISPEKHERMLALNMAVKSRRLTPDELRERADLAEEWLDALAAMRDAGVQIPRRLKDELRKEYESLISYVEAGRRP